MYDIVRLGAVAEKHGFDEIFFFEKAKGSIITIDNIGQAADHRNKKSLILLRNYAYDEGPVKLVAEKKKACFLIDLSRIIKAKGLQRSIEISRVRTFLGICNRFGAFYALASFAEKEEEMRTPEELISIGCLLGLNRGQGRFALKMMTHYAD
ncbi:hypothetical protein H0O02_01260 [Candidatus Micrarchaeota archaeon]|nr:hypothetical protein [Candidatus Micrarchaeota archaeon]